MVHFVSPSGFRVVLHGKIANLTAVPNGRILHHVGPCPTTCVFQRLHVSGFPALRTEVLSTSNKLTQDSVDVNSRKYGYELELGGYPDITLSLDKEFHRVVNSFRISSPG